MNIQIYSRQFLDFRFVYIGSSRRSGGLSVGINLTPSKCCNFDCIYCEVDRKTSCKNPEVDLPAVQAELHRLFELVRSGELFQYPVFRDLPPGRQVIKDIAFSGEGEPTLSPLFPDCVGIIIDQLKRLSLDNIKIILITNSSLLDKSGVMDGIAALQSWKNEIWAKLDAGTDEYLKQINRTDVPLEKIIDNISAAGQKFPLIIQSAFMSVNSIPVADAELSAYIQRLKELISRGTRIEKVQVYTIARPPAEEKAAALPDSQIDAIVDVIRKNTDLKVEGFYQSY
jgi:wyosine [tRNA(Phe)-imidazoG37] synthetase (radical SAM superfamily)